tara:strand:+ start:3591 stop:4178 length:588 start_codon:yes stop_codon:yes gene_type:complete
VNPSQKRKFIKSPEIIWEVKGDAIYTDKRIKSISGAWQIMLLGDGSPTRHLRLLTGFEVSIDLIVMERESLDSNTAPLEIKDLISPLLRRQVWLKCNKDTLAWAESWWNQDQANTHLKEKAEPIWKSLTKGRSELFREVDGLAYVEAPWLKEKFNKCGPYLSRNYRFFRGGKPLTVIREVFNPKLEKWLGPAFTN